MKIAAERIAVETVQPLALEPLGRVQRPVHVPVVDVEEAADQRRLALLLEERIGVGEFVRLHELRERGLDVGELPGVHLAPSGRCRAGGPVGPEARFVEQLGGRAIAIGL